MYPAVPIWLLFNGTIALSKTCNLPAFLYVIA